MCDKWSSVIGLVCVCLSVSVFVCVTKANMLRLSYSAPCILPVHPMCNIHCIAFDVFSPSPVTVTQTLGVKAPPSGAPCWSTSLLAEAHLETGGKNVETFPRTQLHQLPIQSSDLDLELKQGNDGLTTWGSLDKHRSRVNWIVSK